MNFAGECCAWFSLRLEAGACQLLGCDSKKTIIYELELPASCIAMDIWSNQLVSASPCCTGTMTVLDL